MKNSTGRDTAGNRGDHGDRSKPNETGVFVPAQRLWTLASALHIRARMPDRANQARENKMAKKTLKKSKKIHPTKPLIQVGGSFQK